MDWAINAAKKKTKAIPGGSRSIIESLNKLNNISCDGQDAINEILSDIDFSLLGISILPADKNRSLIIKTKILNTWIQSLTVKTITQLETN